MYNCTQLTAGFINFIYTAAGRNDVTTLASFSHHGTVMGNFNWGSISCNNIISKLLGELLTNLAESIDLQEGFLTITDYDNIRSCVI